MRTHGYLFDQYANFDALHDGYLKARKGCRDSYACLRFERRLEENLIDLLNHLHWDSYCTGPYRHFYVHEPKTRRITALTQFRDRVIAKALVRRVIACPRTLAILDDIIDSYCEDGRPGKGMPIGNLISQLLANVYLDALDQYVKCRLGERWYVRYMDDFLIIGPDKQHLHQLRIHLEWWLAEHLELSTNHKTSVFPVHPQQGRGLDFVGYHMWPHKRRLRKGSMKRFKRRVRRLRRQYAAGEIVARDVQLQLNSWLAHASHAQAEGFVRSVIYDTPWEKHHAAVCD